MTLDLHPDTNQGRYESAEVVLHYARQSDLQPCEACLFERYLKPGLAILDLGVGGGRTTVHLAPPAARYVGADYSVAMVEACRKRFPHVQFIHCDATNMQQIENSEFDAVVFSFNGIDYVPTDHARALCFSEVARVLRPGGVFIFSSHNAKLLGLLPVLAGAKPHQIAWRTLLSIKKSAQILSRQLRSSTYQQGEGYIHDPVHGGLATYASTPETIRPQIEAAGLSIVDTLSGPNPEVTARALTPWYYYACIKAGGDRAAPSAE